MSESMIERVAMAIYDVASAEGITIPWRETTKESRELHREYARAAIEAMRQPTDDMVKSCGNGECSRWAPGAWKNYIDAALQD